MSCPQWQVLRVVLMLLALLVAAPAGRAAEPQRSIVARGTPVAIKDASGRQVGLYEESHALVVGVSDYTAGWPDLPGVKQDVRAVQRGLEEAGFSVVLIENPTQQSLTRAYREFITRKGAKANNRLLFYFAGHGHTLTPKYGGRPLGYIVPADAPDPNRDEAGFRRKALSMRRMEEYALEVQSKHALFLFDSCFSGTVFSGARAIPEAIQAKTAKPVRMFITSGDAGQQVPDVSIFRPEFLKGIRGEADLNRDGYVTGVELGMFLSDNVTNYTRGAQTPTYGKLMNPVLNQGDFVFALARMAPSPGATASLPKLPGQTSFDLGAIQAAAAQEKEVRGAWDKRQEEMKAAFAQVEAIDRDTVSASIKRQAWEQFLTAFSEDNPFSTADEGFRKKAEQRNLYWRINIALQSESEKGRPGEIARQRVEQNPANQEESQANDWLHDLTKQGLDAVPRNEHLAQSETKRNHKAAMQLTITETYRDPVTGMELVRVAGGTFEMGCHLNAGPCWDDEKPTRRVTISPFWLGKTEVTQWEWKQIMGENQSRFDSGRHFPMTNTYPAESVSWEEVREFIRRLNTKSSVSYRLPTEAEWEYACRGGGKAITYSWGMEEPAGEQDPVGNIADERSGLEWRVSGYWDRYEHTAPAASYPANSLGLHDMSGNVQEWVQDTLDSYEEAGTNNPNSEIRGFNRVMRGGSWNKPLRGARCTARYSGAPNFRDGSLGFRLARTK